ncbi:hypothetical protein C8J57DRAFT_1258863 [Mycena rebaudengoi]|nr:hypothetical protein C8J57DRAFT_1258863 [Mycena rebaudengoi]
MEIRENDKRLCLHRIDVVIIAAVITILITVTAPSARWWAPPCIDIPPQYFGGHAALISRGTACTQGRQRITYCVGAMCGVAHKALQYNHDPIYCISARQKSGDFTAIIEGGTAVGGTFDGVMASTGAAGDAHMGRRTAMMDSDQGGIFSDVCDHFPPSRHQSRITSEAQFEKGRSDSEVFLTCF